MPFPVSGKPTSCNLDLAWKFIPKKSPIEFSSLTLATFRIPPKEFKGQSASQPNYDVNPLLLRDTYVLRLHQSSGWNKNKDKNRDSERNEKKKTRWSSVPDSRRDTVPRTPRVQTIINHDDNIDDQRQNNRCVQWNHSQR